MNVAYHRFPNLLDCHALIQASPILLTLLHLPRNERKGKEERKERKTEKGKDDKRKKRKENNDKGKIKKRKKKIKTGMKKQE